jgi:hypothetical protein
MEKKDVKNKAWRSFFLIFCFWNNYIHLKKIDKSDFNIFNFKLY